MKKRGRQALGLMLLALPALCQGFSLEPKSLSRPLTTLSRSPCRSLNSFSTNPSTSSTLLRMSSEVHEEEPSESPKETEQQQQQGMLQMLRQTLLQTQTGKRPPVQVDDTNLMLYDVFLLLNLSVSISFWVTHRMSIEYLSASFTEGCLFSILWMASGLYTGAFLYSAVDGHYGSGDARAGPKAAGLLGFHTFLNAVNLRLLVALALAVAEHRPVGTGFGEDVLPLEIGLGFILMSSWRTLHSSSVPRL